MRRGAGLDDLGVIEDGSVLIRDGVIAQVGSTRRVENLKQARGAAELAVDGAVVMPGFVDPALHLGPVAPPAGERRSNSTVFFDQSLTLLRSCLQHGTVHAQFKTGAPDGDLRVTLMLIRQLALMNNQPLGVLRTWRVDWRAAYGNTAEGIAESVPFLAKPNLAQRLEIFGAGADEAAAQETVWKAARNWRLGINLIWPGGEPAALLKALEDARPRTVFIPNELSGEECYLLAECGLPLVITPCAALFKEAMAGSLQALFDHGAGIALASGYDDRQGPVFSMQAAISLAVLKLGMTSEQAITAATVNAAYALGVGNTMGTLESGKRANLLVLRLPHYRELPRRFGSNHVGLVIRDGKVVFNRTNWKVNSE